MINVKVLIAFAAGIIACFATIYSLSYINLEQPLQVGGFKQISTLQEGSGPGDWISNKDIEVYNDKIIIKLENPSISNYASTGSMRPTLDAGHNGIRIRPKSPEEIKEGDIITFTKENSLIVHRVVQKGQDKEGYWFITRGDNNLQNDEKIYFKDIKYITVGILY
jgi:hypothetical protein